MLNIQRHMARLVETLVFGGFLGSLFVFSTGCETAPPVPPVPSLESDRLIPSDTAMQTAKVLVAARPYESKIPDTYNTQKNWPLVILLHGYGANGIAQDVYFGLGKEVDRLGFLYAYPDGLVDSKGKHFWNATDVCCDFDNKGVDDVAYIDAIIDDMASRYQVDKKRVYLVGHSNGGFMSHRFACDRSERVAAIVPLAGDNYKDTSRCTPKQPVAVLQVHGDKDDLVPYEGGTEAGTGRSLPSAIDCVKFWAGIGGCTLTPDTTVPNVDVDRYLPGAESTVTRFPNCKPGGGAELWTIKGGVHMPSLGQPTWADQVWSWFAAHPKP